ncbi:MAG: uracil-DNA glycosylase, partial [Sedimentibacter sp.]
MDELKNFCSKCKKCRLGETRTNIVFGEGNEHADIMFVGEGPGYYEDVQGRPFVGKAGQLLDKMIEAIHFQRSDVYIANIVKCRPPENRNP